MNRILISIIIAVCTIGITQAQNTIKGKVTDSNNSPLVGATIYIPDYSKGTITDSTGTFILKGLPNGKVNISFSYIGYSNVVEVANLIGKEIDINITLHQTPIETEAIVVSGGYSLTQHQNAVKIDVLKLDDQLNIPTPNFAELLAATPGVDMISKGSGVSKPVIRGLSMNDILILDNGVRFENYQYSSHHPLGIDEFGIDEVEVIKGPASLLYGSDAIGGVLNFIKEKPASVGTVVGDYNLQLFSNSLGIVNNVGIKGSSQNFFGGFRFGQKSHADYLQGGGDFVPNSRFNEYSLKTNFGYTGNRFSSKLFYDYNRQNLGLVEDEAIDEIIDRGRKNKIFYQQLSTHLISSQSKFFFGKNRMDLNVSYQSTELIHFGEENEYEIQMRLGTLIYESKLYLPSTLKADYIIGFQGINQINSNLNNRETILLPNANSNTYSVFGLAQRMFFSKLRLQAGVRYDSRTMSTNAVGDVSLTNYRAPLDKYYSSVSGSFGGTYRVNPKLLFRMNSAAAYRTPNIAELTSNGPHETRYELGNQNLVPEKSLEIDASMHFHSDNFLMDVAAFNNWVNNYIFIAPTGLNTTDGLGIYRYMQHNSILYGGEVGLHYHPKSFNWLHLSSTYSMVVGKQSGGDYLPFIPAHKLNFIISASKARLLFVNDVFIALQSNTAFNQNNPAPEEVRTGGYTLFNVSIGGNLKFNNQKVELIFGVSNLFDKKYVDHLSTLKEVNLFNPGRNISFTMKIPFNL